jgi:predicted aminopeptidase
VKSLALLCLAVILTACNPFYVTRAAWEEARVLAAREDISELISRADTPEEETASLKLVSEAGDFAHIFGLSDKPPYRTFSRIDRETFSWVLVACRPDSFELFTWWFPLLGNMPYKGYFEKSDAERMGQNLSEMGYEVSIRPADAISTLGWFDDPLLSTVLKNEDTILANIVFHEALHTKIWVPGDVAYNESLAAFTGAQASLDFFTAREAACDSSACHQKNAALLKRAREIMAFELERSDTLDKLVPELEEH